MAIFTIYIINKAGSLIFHYDHHKNRAEIEKTFSYPLELTLKVFDDRIVVAFGERDGIKVGHTVLQINDVPAEGRFLKDKRDVLEVLASEENYPLSIKFGRPKLTSNQRIMLASMFHSFNYTYIDINALTQEIKSFFGLTSLVSSLFAFGSQLSPELHSSGIEVLETDTFKLHCQQTMTGIKFIVIADPRQSGIDILLKKLYEIYSDFALKNPFYTLDMPIKCELFDNNLHSLVEQSEKLGMNVM